MWRVVLRNLTGHKRRLIGTCSAVVLGVAFLAGTLVLNDTMRASFDNIFASANAGTDAVVQGSQTIGQGTATQSALVPETLLPQIQALPDVEGAAPNIQGFGQLSGSDGKPIGGDGPPTFAGNWITVPGLNPYVLASGHAPEASGEVVINQGAATTGNLAIGDKTTLRTPNPIPVTVVGIVTFGSSSGLGGTTFAGMTFDDAQKYLGYPGKVSSISVQAKEGITQEALVAQIQPLLPSGVEAITGDQLTQDLNNEINEGFLGFFTTFLLVFAVIAVIVASFSIYNTFTVILAQRTRESALLRAIGASRRQVLSSVAGEALLIGVIASVLGVGAGILLAAGMKALMDAAGFGLPAGGVEITAGAVGVALVVGIVVTFAASVLPAIKASRVPPLAAMRDVAIDKSGASGLRTFIGLFMIVIGLIATASMVLNTDYLVYWRAGIGAAMVFIGALVVAPVAALPFSAVIGAPIRWLRGVSGAMAQRNATRNPKRTASTAAALVVGVCIVTLFTIFASSIKVSIENSVAGSFTGQLVMSNSNFNGSGYSPKMVEQISALPQVQDAAAIAQGVVLANGKQLNVTVADPATLGAVMNVQVQVGVPLTEVKPNQLAASVETASANGWFPGNPVTIAFADGSVETLDLATTYNGEELIGGAIVPSAVYEQHVRQTSINTVLIGLASGVSIADGQAAVQTVADQYGAGAVQTRDEFIQSTAAQIDALLNVVYALLALAILIALMGIANTLSLSIHERTRELGLLRAVGQTRSQLRSMVRWESVIIALFGTIGGMVIGVVLGWSLMQAVGQSEAVAEFALPVSQLVTVAIVGGIAGILAGLRPAWRAAKLNILTAIATD